VPGLVRLAGLRYLRRHPWQLVLAVGGVGVGVAVAVSVALATSSARRAFLISSETLTGAATHQIVAGSVGLPDDLYRQLRVDLGLRATAPVAEGLVADLIGSAEAREDAQLVRAAGIVIGWSGRGVRKARARALRAWRRFGKLEPFWSGSA